MPIKDLKNRLPKPEQILKYKSLRMFAPHLSDPRLWHFNRRCLNKAVYIGVISSFFPLPGQMLIALFICLIFRANVPLAITLTWITNPITSIPIYYVSYWVGTKVMDAPMIDFDMIGKILSGFSAWVFSDGSNPFVTFGDVFSLTTFLVGILVLAIISSIVCGIAFRFAWRYKVITTWKKRHGYKPPHLLKKYRNH